MSTRAAVAGAVLLLAVPHRAGAWGCDGHRLVALVAARHLSPAARAGVDALLSRAQLDPTLRRSCPAPALGPFADLATWADDVRAVRPDTAPWHFVDIPRGATDASPARACPRAGCVTRALAAELGVLRDTAAAPARRAEALLFVVHLIADLHQPLHCVTNGDRGGNCVPVTSFGERPHRRIDATHPARNEDWEPNLHGVWDTDLVRARMGRASLATYARRLDDRFRTRMDAWRAGGADVDAWARETHAVAVAVAYGRLPRPVPVEPARDVAHCRDRDHVARRMLALHETIDAAYLAAAGPVVDEQLARAGVRLAMLLNDVWR